MKFILLLLNVKFKQKKVMSSSYIDEQCFSFFVFKATVFTLKGGMDMTLPMGNGKLEHV